MKYVVTVPEDVAGISCTYLRIMAAMLLLSVAIDQVQPILPKVQDEKSLILH